MPDGDYDDDDLLGPVREPEVTHLCPPDGGDGLFPCCGRTPFEVPPWQHRMTLDPALVTCSPGSESAPVAQAGETP